MALLKETRTNPVWSMDSIYAFRGSWETFDGLTGVLIDYFDSAIYMQTIFITKEYSFIFIFESVSVYLILYWPVWVEKSLGSTSSTIASASYINKALKSPRITVGKMG